MRSKDSWARSLPPSKATTDFADIGQVSEGFLTISFKDGNKVVRITVSCKADPRKASSSGFPPALGQPKNCHTE